MAHSDTTKYSEFVRRVLTAYGKRVVDGGDTDSLAELADLSRQVDATTEQVVRRLMADHGYSYADVARGLGVSRQAVRQRFGVAPAPTPSLAVPGPLA